MRRSIKKIVLIAGGVGGAKLAEGLNSIKDINLTIIGNIADDDEFHGLRVSPDIDTLTYTLSGMVNRKQGWGVKNDNYKTLSMLNKLGEETWMSLGDLDFGLHIYRQHKLLKDHRPTVIANEIAKKLGVRADIILPTDDKIRTEVQTKSGWISFQEYFVKKRCSPKIIKLKYTGIKSAKITKEAKKALFNAELIIIAPSNPLVSIKPILEIPGFKSIIRKNNKRVIAVSPLIQGKAVKGPATKMLEQLGFKPNSFSCMQMYNDICKTFILDMSDIGLEKQFISLNQKPFFTDTLMTNLADKRRLAKFIINQPID
ncbi:MAG: 2-phospho-L-lactate transferase [Pseudomonadota bacterium]|nr:2-phospho-L-lactate transferase [Pseudomonadota bacterium]MEC8760175.1 2-phospho-L-lactate transferase [Pseudomonadota bacterium]